METIIIKYHDKEMPKLGLVDDKSDWIDLRASERVELKSGEYKHVRLGVSMKLPEGFEAHIIPRSSLFKNYSVMQANSYGLVDNTYCGDDDEWRFTAYAIKDTVIEKHERICQFRIVEKQPEINFVEIDRLEGKTRGGFGSTGKK